MHAFKEFCVGTVETRWLKGEEGKEYFIHRHIDYTAKAMAFVTFSKYRFRCSEPPSPPSPFPLICQIQFRLFDIVLCVRYRENTR